MLQQNLGIKTLHNVQYETLILKIIFNSVINYYCYLNCF